MSGRILDFLFPPRCVFCHDFLKRDEFEGKICARCLSKVISPESRKAGGGEFFSKALSLMDYDSDMRKSIHRFKFSGAKGYARVYAGMLAFAIAEDSEIASADIITYVPTNPKNIRRRGYNHTRLLAEELSALCTKPVVESLKKIRSTSPMYGLKPHERRANILGAIGLAAGHELLQGKSVLLVDDLITTGATAAECARVLLSGGCKKVYLATVARA